jgi:hypothetical protein
LSTIDADFAVALVLSMTAFAVVTFVVMVITMLVVIQRNLAQSDIDGYADE